MALDFDKDCSDLDGASMLRAPATVHYSRAFNFPLTKNGENAVSGREEYIAEGM